MIETDQSIVIDAPIDAVWRYASDIKQWASLMPGLQDYEILTDDDSRWRLKVGVGALVRTVNVSVNVDRWAGPDQVDFKYSLKGDPVEGGGTYRARSLSKNQTEITLGVQVVGTGPMAPMWEAMGKPLLPKFARGFAEQFKTEIERANCPGAEALAPTSITGSPVSIFTKLLTWLARLFSGKATAARRNLGDAK